MKVTNGSNGNGYGSEDHTNSSGCSNGSGNDNGHKSNGTTSGTVDSTNGHSNGHSNGQSNGHSNGNQSNGNGHSYNSNGNGHTNGTSTNGTNGSGSSYGNGSSDLNGISPTNGSTGSTNSSATSSKTGSGGDETKDVPMATDSPARLRGKVKWFNAHTGWGWITADPPRDEAVEELSEDIFVHIDDIEAKCQEYEGKSMAGLRDGESVEFSVAPGRKIGQLKAVRVTGPAGDNVIGQSITAVRDRGEKRCYDDTREKESDS